MKTPFIFCDETALFRQPADPGPGEPFRLRVWVSRQPGQVVTFLCRSDSGSSFLDAKKAGERGRYDVYEAAHPGTEEEVFYFVNVSCEGESWLFGRNGLRRENEIVPFSVNPYFDVPAWARGALWYQIFPDRFCNGDTTNDVLTGEVFDDVELVSRKMRWDDPVTALDVHHSYGGDLQGIINKLDYLKALGIEVIYLNPIFVAPSCHGYNTQDYEHVDPHFGRILEDGEGRSQYQTRTTSAVNLEASDALLAELISQAHRKGMRVVLDGVFNHCSSFHPWYNEAGLYDHSLERRDFFRCDEKGEKECWWGNKNLLKLDVDGNADLREALLQIAEKWLLPPYSADGWRLDVAADVGHDPEGNHAFWRAFRERVRKARPDALILAEHYGDPSPWFGGDEWDSVMNYDAFMEPVRWFCTGMEKHGDRHVPWMEGAGEAFRESMVQAMARFPRASLEAALNQLDNHDHSRFLTRTNHVVGRLGELGYRMAENGVDKSILRAAALLQMTWPGAPGIYYGDEAGVPGFTDPDNRRPFPWGREDTFLFDFYSSITRLHRRYDVLRRGSLRILRAEDGLLVYARMDASDTMLVAINQTAEDRRVELNTAEIDGIGGTMAQRLAETWAEGYNLGRQVMQLPNRVFAVTLKPRAAALYAVMLPAVPKDMRDRMVLR